MNYHWIAFIDGHVTKLLFKWNINSFTFTQITIQWLVEKKRKIGDSKTNFPYVFTYFQGLNL